ncbi:MAG TPA: transposase [Planctomycetaceae bacterium]|nr:transposase [Planctomycetaceae bacterium]
MPRVLCRTCRLERQRLEETLRLNDSLAKAYSLKGDLLQVWEHPDKRTGELVLERRIRMAEASGIRPLIQLAKTLRKHRQDLLAWYDHPISTGFAGGGEHQDQTPAAAGVRLSRQGILQAQAARFAPQSARIRRLSRNV